MIDFTSRQLRAFLLVARHRSFTRAAGALFITPSGLSVLIRELETQLGARLFDRTTRQVALTAAGAELLAAVERNLQELDGALSQVGRSAAESGPSLSVGAPPVIAAGFLAEAITDFRRRQPGVRFQLWDGDTATTLQKVEAGALDMGLGHFFKHSPGIRRTSLFRSSMMVIRAGTGQARRASTPWSALKGEKLVTLQPSTPLQQLVDRHLARAGAVHQPRLVLNYLNTLIAMVEAGEGIAIVPSFALPDCRARGVVTSRLVNPIVHLDFYQIRRGGRKLPPVGEEFTTFLQSYVVGWAERSGLV
jgi:LysR family transcriptional regulator, carnitine catabolism transcriptional activator